MRSLFKLLFYYEKIQWNIEISTFWAVIWYNISIHNLYYVNKIERGVTVEEKQILKELLREIMLIEKDLKLNMWLIKRSLPNEEKIKIVENLEKVEKIYDKNLENIRSLNCKYIKKDLKKLDKALNKLIIYKSKIKSSIEMSEVNYEWKDSSS